MNTHDFEANLEDLPELVKSIMEYRDHETILVFRGELGAGKTTLIKNICNFLGVKDGVSSPTFSIVNEYSTQEKEKIYHFDFYRMKNEEEALDIGVEEYFDSGHLCLIEWPEKIESLLPESRMEIQIVPDSNKRKFIINKKVNV